MSFSEGPTVQNLTEILQRDEYTADYLSELIGVLEVKGRRQKCFQSQLSSHEFIKCILKEVVGKRGESAPIGWLIQKLKYGGFVYTAGSYK